jgi:transposase
MYTSGMKEKRGTHTAESIRLEGLYRKATDPVLRSHLLMVWRVSVGDPIRKVAEVVGYSEKWVREVARRYDSEGVEGLGDRRHRNPGAKDRALLDDEGRRELARALRERPSDGGMWNSRKVAEWIEHKTGKKASKQRGWEYLRKLGHSPKVPRPRHAEADGREQEAFKKGSR